MSHSLKQRPVYLDPHGGAEVEPIFTGDMAWYQGFGERHGADGDGGRLVALHQFSKNWDVWEMHPNGHEVVICTEGEMTLIQEIDGEEKRTTLRDGDFAINPPGVWHTADCSGSGCSAVFITSGRGTEHRQRE